MDVFFKLYEGLKREGPGSLAMTKRAYEMVLLEGMVLSYMDKPFVELLPFAECYA